MDNYNRKIIVICKSDVILKGLADILSGCNADEIILLHQVNDILDYPHLSGYVLLIMPQDTFNQRNSYLKHALSNCINISHITLIFDEEDKMSDDSINIYADHSKIINTVNRSLSSFALKNEDLNELSPRETDVLRLVVKGLSNKAVADELSISIHTVISHRKKISEKTSIKSVSGLTMYAVLMKIIDIDDVKLSDLI